jgi:hypothetical protein
MPISNDKRLERRVVDAAEATLAERDLVTAVDILMRLGWLPSSGEQAWRQREFLEEAAALARRGLYNRRGVPRGPRAALELFEFLDRHAENTVAFRPPWLQRLLVPPLARLARRLGVTARRQAP